MAAQKSFNKGDLIEIHVDSLAYGGRGVGRRDGLAVFVQGAAPGDTARARVTRRKKDFAEAVLEELITPGPGRAEPPCPLFGECGGCSWQHLAYETQAAAKRSIVRDAIERIGGVAGVEVRETAAAPRPLRYRNKMEFAFGRAASGEVILGFHRPGSWSEILEVPRCYLHPEPFDRLLAAATAWARETGATPHDLRTHTGDLRHFILRTSEASGGVVAVLITFSDRTRQVDALERALREACPSLQGFVWGVNTGVSDVARIEREMGVWGDPVLVDRIGGLSFRVSPQSFFQTNTLGAARLYQLAKEALALDGNQKLLDAYCGAGTIGLFCADACREVWGIEIVREAVWDARDNARRNRIDNARFISGDLKQVLPLACQAGPGEFDRVVMDPPRSGMEKKALRQLLELRAPIAVYVSCNPATLSRDIQSAVEAGYRVDSITPVDMFPQTYHIEAVARLSLVTA